MERPNQNIINAIFEESVIEALSLYGIDVPKRADDTFSNYNPKKIFLRESILNKIEFDWLRSDLTAEIGYIPPTSGVSDEVGKYDSEKMRKVVRDYVKKEIYLETGRMEADAQRKIAELIIEGDLLKKGGAKKAWDSLVATVSPDSAKFNTLMGTKVSSHEGYRKAVLDVIYSRTSGGLVAELGKLESVGGKVVGRPAESTVSEEGVVTLTPLKPDQTFAKGIIEILENPTREEKISTTITSEAEKIKKDFENHPDVKSRRDEIKEKMKTALVNRADYSRVQVLQREIEDLYESTPMGGTTYSTKQRLENELKSTNRRVSGGALSGASGGTVPSLISSAREYQFFGSGRPTLSSVWESHPELKIKIDEYTKKLNSSTDLIRRAYYQKKLDYYSDQYSLLGGSVANAFSFSFSNGEIVIKDNLREKYDRATKNFAQGLKFLDFSGELNRLRKEHLEVDLIVLQEMQDSLRKNYYRTRNKLKKLSKKERKLLELSEDEGRLLDSISKSTDELVKRFAIHSQVLSLVESMRSVNPSDPEYLQLKNTVLANLAIYETDAAKRKAIEDAINANDRRLLKQLINSGGGNTDFDKKHAKLYEDFIELASKTDEALLSGVLRKRGYTEEQIKKFTTWANKRALDNEIIKSFVVRRQVETVIYAAQLMTDQKYLQKEVKRLIHQEVQVRLTTKLINLFPYNEYFGYTVGWFYELGSQDNKWEWLKKEGWKKIVSSFKENVEKTSFFIKLQSRLNAYSPLGVELKIDLYKLIENPKEYSKEKLKFFLQFYIYERILNKFFRKTVEKFWQVYSLFKKSWNYIKITSLRLIQFYLYKYGGVIGARLAGALFAASIPVIGWIIGAVIAVLPILLKPFFGDVDLITMLKKALKFVCLLPAIIFMAIFMLVIAPIISLLTNIVEPLKQYLSFNDDLYEYSMKNDWNFGVTGEFELTYEVADGLVTTSENKCLKLDGSALYPPIPDNAGSWNNLKVEDFNNGIQSPKSYAMNCKILCNMQKYMLTLYPGVGGFVNCNATQKGQGLFGGTEGAADEKFWCTYTVTTAYGDDFTELSDDKKYASVFALNNYFNDRVGTNFEKIDFRECFEKEKIMSGAAIMMSKDSSCDIPNVKNTNHAAVFLKFEDNKFYYVNTNSGKIKESVEFTDCGGGKVKLKDKAYSTTNIFKMCHAYQPLNVPDLLNSGRCPSQCIPDKLNY